MKIEDYPHVVDPFAHQREHLLQHSENRAWGLLWEQGTAKTKPVIDTGCFLYLSGKINGILVVAPPGVERNWKSDELPTHMLAEVADDTVAEVFKSERKHTVNHRQRMARLVAHDGLAILLISYPAFMTKDGKKVVWDFLKKRRCLMVLDESHNIKSPGAKRTLSTVAAGKHALYRRILTGTPMAKGPFDLYSQIRFLDDQFWKRRGIGGAEEFRAHFGRYATQEELVEMYPDRRTPDYPVLLGYRNLDELSEWMGKITDRVLKTDVLDLPPKLYTKRYFEMTSEQQAVYDNIRDKMFHEFEDKSYVDVDLAIVKLLRLQQVLCGYVPVEHDTADPEPFMEIPGKNNRLGVMEQIRDESSGPTIVWARFTRDIDKLLDLLGKGAVRYDGKISQDDAEKNKLRFQKGDADWFVGTTQKGGPGLTLTISKHTVYYANSFKLIDRLQSEDRPHRAGMDDNAVLYTDIVCPGTMDEKTVVNLREKRDISVGILGDKVSEWI
jgi:SNF2 family DNA or RNA helicase